MTIKVAIEIFAKRKMTAGGLCLMVACGFALALPAAFAQVGGTEGEQPSTSGLGAQSGAISTQQTSPSTSPLLNQSILYPGEDFQLGPGDLILVRVFLQPDYQATVRLDRDGNAQLPFIGSVPLRGLTVREAQNRIADRLRTGGFYKNPEVTIQVLDTVNGSVIVTGEVKASVPVSTERSLREVLLMAGGLPANASHTVKIVRPGMENPIVVNLGTDLASSTAANIMVKPHDIIQITRASVVYVLGAFAHQGAVPLDQATPLTLLQAAALSGGINFEGNYKDLRLIRTVDNDGKPERRVIDVDIEKVREGKAPDPVLQADDIVFLPTNEMKAALKSAGTGGVLGIVGIILASHAY